MTYNITPAEICVESVSEGRCLCELPVPTAQHRDCLVHCWHLIEEEVLEWHLSQTRLRVLFLNLRHKRTLHTLKRVLVLPVAKIGHRRLDTVHSTPLDIFLDKKEENRRWKNQKGESGKLKEE